VAIEPFIVHELVSFVVPGVVVIALGIPTIRLITKWLEPRAGVPRGELAAIDNRLARIETAIDAIAIEVERVSESQRFAAKLDAPQLGPPSGRS
jgi:hypothetical protein